MIHADVRFNQTYHCSVCEKTREGDTVSLHTSVFTAEDLKNEVESVPLDPRNMPIGWCSCWGAEGTVYKCPDCFTSGKP